MVCSGKSRQAKLSGREGLVWERSPDAVRSRLTLVTPQTDGPFDGLGGAVVVGFPVLSRPCTSSSVVFVLLLHERVACVVFS